MRTSLHEAAAIEAHLLKTASIPDELLLEAKQIIDPSLRERVAAQQQTYQLIQQYGRKQLKAELETTHQRLFNEPKYRGFAGRVKKFFGA